MEDYFPWLIENAHWLWLSAGVLLLAGEMILPGVYLMWIGLASVAAGGVAWLMPEMGFTGHGLIFAVLAAASIYVGNQYFYNRRKEQAPMTVNTRGHDHVGKIYTLASAIKSGRGQVQVRDSQWPAEGPDLPKGARVKVKAVDGIVLVVEAVEEQ
ncbi:MAG: NfeD family protein [Alphaproteobacteria bacterium]|nr:NfeD family protein [Alphaproteobacteria bacterium]